MAKKQIKQNRYSEYYLLGFREGVFGLGIALDCNKKVPYIEGYIAGKKAFLQAEKHAEKNNG